MSRNDDKEKKKDKDEKITAHDREQDENIRENAENIARQTAYLQDIRNHFLPEAEERRLKQLQKMTFKVVSSLLLGFAFIAGLWELGGWYWDRMEMRSMAGRYAEVAEEMYYVEGNPDVALEFLNRAIELHETNAEYRFLRAYMDGMAVARLLLNLDRPLKKTELDAAHQALAQAKFLKGLEPDRAEPYILEGQVYVVLKEYERAREKIEHAITLDPQSDFAQVRLATLLLEMDKADEAAKALDRALELNPKSKWALLWKGVLLSDKRKDYKAARAAFDEALEIDPRFDLALYNLGWTWVSREEKNYAKAREIMQKVLAINPDYKEAYYAIGMFYGYQNNYEVAQVYMDKALRVDKEFLTALKWRGIVRTEMGRYAEAIGDFDEAVRLDPMNAELYVRRAGALEKSGRLDRAMSNLRFAAELEPENKRTWLIMGRVFLKAKNPERAMESYKKALELDESYAEAHAGIADVLMARARPDDALKCLEKAVQVTKYRPERFILKKGRILEQTSRRDEALAAYRKVREADARHFDAWWAEALLCEKMDRKAAALAAVKTCLELRPQHEEAAKLKARLEK